MIDVKLAVNIYQFFNSPTNYLQYDCYRPRTRKILSAHDIKVYKATAAKKRI